jgi:hypothetical protein
VQQPEPANRSPARKGGELDNHGSHFCLALHWAQALAAQGKSAALQFRFNKLAETLAANETRINAELIAAQGKPIDIGGYYPARSRHGGQSRCSAWLKLTRAKPSMDTRVLCKTIATRPPSPGWCVSVTFPGLGFHFRGAMDVAVGIAADDDRLRPARHQRGTFSQMISLFLMDPQMMRSSHPRRAPRPGSSPGSSPSCPRPERCGPGSPSATVPQVGGHSHPTARSKRGATCSCIRSRGKLMQGRWR